MNIDKKKKVLDKILNNKRSVFTLLMCSGGVKKNTYLEEAIDKVIDVKTLLLPD